MPNDNDYKLYLDKTGLERYHARLVGGTVDSTPVRGLVNETIDTSVSANIADAYNSATPYDNGAYVTHLGQLYKSKADNNTGHEPGASGSANYWEAVQVMEQVAGAFPAQDAHKVFAGPTSGSAATPEFRILDATDIPDLSSTYIPTSKITAAGDLIIGGADAKPATRTIGANGQILTAVTAGNVTLPVWQTLYGTAIAASSTDSTKLIDGTGKIPTSLLPESVTSGMEYKGTFNASTASGSISGLETGWFYICATAGSKNPDGTAGPSDGYAVGDWAVYNGSTAGWAKIDNDGKVQAVNGQTGTVIVPVASLVTTTGSESISVDTDPTDNPDATTSTLNVVTRDTAQTITGAKEFRGTLTIDESIGGSDTYLEGGTTFTIRNNMAGVSITGSGDYSTFSIGSAQHKWEFNVNGSSGASGQVLKIDQNGKPYWAADLNDDHYPTAFSWTNGTTAGPTGSLTGNSGFSAVSFDAIPTASSSQSGIVTTDTQTFAGDKQFFGALKRVGSNPSASNTINLNGFSIGSSTGGETNIIIGQPGASKTFNATFNTPTVSTTPQSNTYTLPSQNGTLVVDADLPEVTFSTTAYPSGATTILGMQVGNDKYNFASDNFYATSIANSGLKIANGYASGTASSTYDLYVPNASASASGVVTTGAQTFKGSKTFDDDITVTGGNINITCSGHTPSEGLKINAAGTFTKYTDYAITIDDAKIFNLPSTKADGTYTLATLDDITVTGVNDGIFDLNVNSSKQVEVKPYPDSTATSTWVGNDDNAGKFYLGTQNPGKTTRLNYNGYLYATQFNAVSSVANSDKVTISNSLLKVENSGSTAGTAISKNKVTNWTTSSNTTEITIPVKGGTGYTFALLENIAEAYSSSATYTPNQMVVHSNKLYRCNTAISTAEAWTAAHWTETTVQAAVPTVPISSTEIDALFGISS